MKTKILLLLITILLMAFTSCNEGRSRTSRSATEGKINVTTSIFAPYDFVRQIAGDKVNLSMLLPPGSESHSFEPSPRDIITIMNSDVFIYIGGESERWVQRILQSMNTNSMNILAMMDVVEIFEEEFVEGMEIDYHDDNDDEDEDHYYGDGHDHDHDEVSFDEHVWTSPRNAILIVKEIARLLSYVDPANAYFYEENARAYTAELESLDADFREVVTQGNRRTIVFGDRFPFRYFAHAYGLDYFAAFPGCSTETEPSAATVAFLINKIRDEQIPVVFHIELSNERMADTISAETGARKLQLHAAHSITRRDFDAGITYLQIMRSNISALREALK